MRLAATGCLAALALACQNTGALHVRTQAAESTDFARYRTYAQAPPPEADGTLVEYTEITGRKLAARIAERLEQTGLVAAPWEQADLQVALSVGGQARVDVWDWHYSVVAGSTGSMPVLTGSLRVDVVDRRRARVVWQGLAWQETMDEHLGEARGLRAVERLMARFPDGDSKRRGRARGGDPRGARSPEEDEKP